MNSPPWGRRDRVLTREFITAAGLDELASLGKARHVEARAEQAVAEPR